MFSSEEVKQDLAIAPTDTTYNGQLGRFIKIAVNIIEEHIQEDVAITSCVLEEDSFLTPFTYTNYCIKHSNITITAITVTSNGVTVIVDPFSYDIEKNSCSTIIRFKNAISGNVLKIYYQAGYTTNVPDVLKRAVSLKCSEMLDIDRGGYVSNTMYATKAFERLLACLTNLIY
jgi:hypothetical protein